MDSFRTQLTLFVSDDSGVIENIRKQLNPIQYNLIAAHVTLCREGELAPIRVILDNIQLIRRNGPIRIEFGPAERFADGKGVRIPAKAGYAEFFELRKSILMRSNVQPEKQFPHITLMHPRNSTCTDVIFDQINRYQLPKVFSFHKISLIEQRNGERWRIIDEFPIAQDTL